MSPRSDKATATSSPMSISTTLLCESCAGPGPQGEHARVDVTGVGFNSHAGPATAVPGSAVLGLLQVIAECEVEHLVHRLCHPRNCFRDRTNRIYHALDTGVRLRIVALQGDSRPPANITGSHHV